MMSTRSGGGAAAAPGVCLFIECCREAECLAVEVVPISGSWQFISLVGLQGWDVCGQTLQTSQTSEARGEGRECGGRFSPSCGCGSGRQFTGAGWSSRKPERSERGA